MAPDQPPYTIFQHKGQDVGALYQLMAEQVKQGVPPNWCPYVAVDDCAATMEKVKAKGGAILMGPYDVMKTYGRMAVCKDPQGAVFSIWQAMDHIGASILNEPGALCWTELMTPDTAGAQAFYTSVIGWKAQPMSMPGGAGEYTIFQRGDANAGGMMAITAQMPNVPPNWNSYFQVADVDDTVKRAAGMGAKVIVPPRDIPNVGRFAVLCDPQGAHFSLLQAAQ
jgi:predicted enzyme related to lactoylglutathione lyase